jgi:hypothetical protein
VPRPDVTARRLAEPMRSPAGNWRILSASGERLRITRRGMLGRRADRGQVDLSEAQWPC